MIHENYVWQDTNASEHALLLFGHGDGGGGPAREMFAQLNRLSDVDGLPVVRTGSADEFFDAIQVRGVCLRLRWRDHVRPATGRASCSG